MGLSRDFKEGYDLGKRVGKDEGYAEARATVSEALSVLKSPNASAKLVVLANTFLEDFFNRENERCQEKSIEI